MAAKKATGVRAIYADTPERYSARVEQMLADGYTLMSAGYENGIWWAILTK